ncbi:uncharacterized protein LOC115876941 [Sitophilus oryzae]|uniref:Uncharacterized protein LOC115876941 n=1 Tax=Sitophilus oryzae TaxID=7048 RepID=A0A6J2XBZ8_SITOR|nr:uncharacterized protein LOC115876941 [Sitophilus oryzae]
MVKVCVVKSCSSRREDKGQIESYPVSFFQPTTTTRLERWSKALGISLKTRDNICQFHFKEEDVKMYDKIVIGDTIHLHYLQRKILKEEALPTRKHQFELNSELLQEQQAREDQFVKQQQYKKTKQQQPKEEPLSQEQQHEQSEQEIIQFEEQPKYEIQDPLNQDDQLEQTEQDQHFVEHQITEIIEPIAEIKKNISALPPCWLYIDKPKEIEFMRLDPTSKQILNHIILKEDLSITVVCSNNERKALDEKIVSIDEVYKYLKSVEKWPLCVGTQFEEKRYSDDCKGVVFGDEAYKRHQMNPRCVSCRVLRLLFQKHGTS